MPRKVIATVLVAAGLVAPIYGQPKTKAQKEMEATAKAAKVKGCPKTLWGHVYNPERLSIYSNCITVTGEIVDATKGKRRDGVRREKDGDTHGWLKLDPQFKALLNSGNKKQEDGNLVFEIVCYWTPTQQSALGACPGFKNKIVLPPVGSHVAITGAYVQDDNHAHWMEIHPVYKIKVIQ